ncbi:MAG: MBL fold metallo-hydrolase [Gammaproteobacteria bacterium]|nr:MBL fold metallo-hydrolase [Gammaproteobacteria bacterium]
MTTPRLTVKQLFDRESCTYTYLLIDPQTGEGAIIDPVLELFERDLQIINELGVELLYAIETHAHADHITSSGKLREQVGARLVYGRDSGIEAIDIPLADGETITLGHYQVRALFTPGHTNGCTCYFVDGMLFSGDTLLIRGCGRTDFQNGDAGQLYDSITHKLFVLSDDTIVYPAHDYNGRTSSTIGEEKRWNPRLGGGRPRQEFVDLMNNLNLDMPKRINEAVPANMSVGINFDANRYLLRDFSMDDLHGVWQDLPKSTLVMDNRTPDEFARGHVPGARNIPMGTENGHVDELRQFERVYLYCRSGRRAQTTMTNLSFQGLNHVVCVSHSGMPDWEKAGYPVET